MSYLKLGGKELSNKIKNQIKKNSVNYHQWFGNPGLGIILVERDQIQKYMLK